MIIKSPETLLKVPGDIDGYLVILLSDDSCMACHVGGCSLIFEFNIQPVIIRSVGRRKDGDYGWDTLAF